MSFNRHFFQNLDLGKYSKPNPYKDDIIVDPAGQYKYPGQPTRIPSNRLTMGGVPYPVWAQPNVGPGMMMYPGGEYEFPEADYVDEIPMAQKGIISVGPQYDSRYGTMGNLGYETEFHGQRDRSTIHNLRGDIYGGDFGFGVAGTHKFGTERRDVPVMGFAENRLGYDTLRGAHLDFKGGADIHLLKDRYRGNLDITPFGGVWGQTKAREESIDPNNFGSNVGLTYGVRANYGKDLGGGRFNAFAGIEGSPSLGKLTGEDAASSETLQFAPQWNVGMSYGLPVNKTVRKIKALAKAKQKDKEIQEATKPRLAAVNRSTPSFGTGGSYLEPYQTQGQVVTPAAPATEPTEEEIFQATLDWFNTNPYGDMPAWEKLNEVTGAASQVPKWKEIQGDEPNTKTQGLYVPFANVTARPTVEGQKQKRSQYYYNTVPMGDDDTRLNIAMINDKPMVIAPQQGDMSNADYKKITKMYDRFNKQYLHTMKKPSIRRNAPDEVFHVYGRGLPYRPSLQEQYYEQYPSMVPQQRRGGSTPCYKCGAEVYNRVMQGGGEYVDVELSNEDIQMLRDGGYRVEDI